MKNGPIKDRSGAQGGPSTLQLHYADFNLRLLQTSHISDGLRVFSRAAFSSGTAETLMGLCLAVKNEELFNKLRRSTCFRTRDRLMKRVNCVIDVRCQ